MNPFEINKIIAAIILTLGVVIGIDKLSDVVYKVEAPSQVAYKVASDTKKK